MDSVIQCYGNCEGSQRQGGGSNEEGGQTMVAVYSLSATGGIILLCIVYAFFCKSVEEEHDLLPTRSTSTNGSTDQCNKKVKVCKLPSHTKIVVLPGQQVQLAVRATPSPTMSRFDPLDSSIQMQQSVRSAAIHSPLRNSVSKSMNACNFTKDGV
eukprot:TRINITY_DN6938_c0_g1_i3.p3 TRINITY_DN6938_c0_g1~~TRINITY_DN6938_c0_g1_i3.p3  ORF type:complete len:163 (-),score=1.97 TRINITY_DN6938_c0_g1_i3:73-537(-)